MVVKRYNVELCVTRFCGEKFIKNPFKASRGISYNAYQFSLASDHDDIDDSSIRWYDTFTYFMTMLLEV